MLFTPYHRPKWPAEAGRTAQARDACVAAGAIHQLSIPKRLLDELEGTFLHRLYRHGHIAVARDANHRQHRAHSIQLLLHLQAAHFRHADIEFEAPCASGLNCDKNSLGRENTAVL